MKRREATECHEYCWIVFFNDTATTEIYTLSLHDALPILEKDNRYSDNEVEKRRSKNYGLGALLYRPLWAFFKSYVMHTKCKSGIPGFIDSVLDGFYQFMIVAKIIEDRIKRKREKSSEE